MKLMMTLYKLLAKIILANMWLIVRHIEPTIKKSQFMYAILIDVPIDLATHFIDVIKKALFDKE